MTDEEIIAARVEEEVRGQAFLLAFRRELIALFEQHRLRTIAAWASRSDSRGSTRDALFVEVGQMADEVLDARGLDFVRRLTAAAGVAGAFLCVYRDDPFEVGWTYLPEDALELEERLLDDSLWLGPATASDEQRIVCRAAIMDRLRRVAAAEFDEYDSVDELFWCIATSSALETTECGGFDGCRPA